MTEQRMVYANPKEGGVIRTLCEMEDTPGPDTKIFRFKEWPGKWSHGYQSGQREDGTPNGPVCRISVYSSWNDEFDVGKIVGRYRVTAKLDTPEGYVAAYEGTTKPEPQPAAVVTDDHDINRERLLKIEDAIMRVLESDPRVTLRTLKRKAHAERFNSDDWDACLKSLADGGELQIEQDPQSAKRTWVSVIIDTNQDGDTQRTDGSALMPAVPTVPTKKLSLES